MPKKVYEPNLKIISVLAEQSGKTFTVVKVRDILRKDSDANICPNDLRRWVNGQFQTLLKHGYIRRSQSSTKPIQYLNTEKIETFKSQKKEIKEEGPKEYCGSSTLNILAERMKLCKLEMLSYHGETKEYEELSLQFPKLREKLQTKFNIAHENYVELKGRVKALEALLEDLVE